MNLTTEQEKIVLSNCKINLASACPGSGKSTVLVARAERLWNDFSEPILIVTFGNDAAKDVAKRITNPHIKVQTIHSFCNGVVRDYWHVLKDIVGGEDWCDESHLVTKIEEIELIKSIFKGDPEKHYELFIKLRDLGITPGTALRLWKKGIYVGRFSQTDLENWDRYERIRLAKGWITFDDMTNLTSMIMTLPEVSVGVCRKYSHILIDEAQDTSESQITVLRPLITHCKSCLVVYDKNQAIYAFRGADGSILDQLGYLQDAVVFQLTESFRNGKQVANFANRIVHNKSSQIRTNQGETEFKVTGFSTRKEEIDYVLGKVEPDCAILSRTNFYLEQFERECIKRKISYSGHGFYRSPHIKALNKFIADKGEVKDVIQQAFLENARYTRIEKEDFKLVQHIIDDEGIDMLHYLISTSNAMNEEGLVLSTSHKSKGLQWPKVYVVGCSLGHTPHRLSNDEVEERNLFYVACTRAQSKGLELTYYDKPSPFLI